MTTKIDIVNGLISVGYAEAETNFSRKNIQRIIKDGIKRAGCNLLFANVPTHSIPQNGKEMEKVSVDHIFETLIEFGDAQGDVIRITPNSYMAYVADAEYVAKTLDRMCIDDRVIRVTHYPIASPLVLDSKGATKSASKSNTQMRDYIHEDLVVQDNSGRLSFLIACVVVYFMILCLWLRYVYPFM